MDKYLQAYADLVDAPKGFISSTISSALGPDIRRLRGQGDWTSHLSEIATKWMTEVDPDFDIEHEDAGRKMAERISNRVPDESWAPKFTRGFASLTLSLPYDRVPPASPSYSPLGDSFISEDLLGDQNTERAGHSNRKIEFPSTGQDVSNKTEIFKSVNKNTAFNLPEAKRFKHSHDVNNSEPKPAFTVKKSTFAPPLLENKSAFPLPKPSFENQRGYQQNTNFTARESNSERPKFIPKPSYDNPKAYQQNTNFTVGESNFERPKFAPKASTSYDNQRAYQQPGYHAPVKDEEKEKKTGPFSTARAELVKQNMKKFGHPGNIPDNKPQQAPQKRSLGGRTRIMNSVVKNNDPEPEPMESTGNEELDKLVATNEEYKNFVSMIQSEVMDVKNKVTWDDIAGLKHVKEAIEEIVVMPLLCPEIFHGLRAPPKGLLLFGPPGTGKTMIGKCIASEANATFFSVSASTVTSKWFGTGEKMVKTLFAVARAYQPSVVFIDEIDSLLTSRSENEHESNRRMKTEFLVQMDGVGGCEEDRVLVVGATNRPQELDDAARRRLQKRLYVPLPDHEARQYLIMSLISTHTNTMDEETYCQVANLTDGYSCADITYLCKEASMGPVRGIPNSQLKRMSPAQIPPVAFNHFQAAIKVVKPSVASETLSSYEEWNTRFGFGG